MADLPSRKPLRLSGYDYSTPTYYFVTVCTRGRQCWLGDIVEDKMIPSPAGDIVDKCWRSSIERFDAIEADEYVVMPNYFHGLFLVSVGDAVMRPEDRTQMTVPRFMQYFKAHVSAALRQAGLVDFGWQRSYHDHVIRDDKDLEAIREYVHYNPNRWFQDREYVPS